MFGFEKLDVHQLSLRFVVDAAEIIRGLPRGQSAKATQLRRTSMSITLNIAESSGRLRHADAARHVTIARGSAMECAAILDICRVQSMGEAGLIGEARGMLLRIVQMLTRLEQSKLG